MDYLATWHYELDRLLFFSLLLSYSLGFHSLPFVCGWHVTLLATKSRPSFNGLPAMSCVVLKAGYKLAASETQ